MPRPPRIDFPDARHHVYNRGARREPIFLHDDDCQVFLNLLGECQLRFAVRVHAYALMGNHFHLLVSTPRANLAEVMGFLQSRYAQHLNQVHHWDGPIFKARYRNRVVEDTAYWRHLLAYLHLNPVEAHLVGRPEDARWTSHRAYLGLEPTPGWLETAELLDLFGGPEQIQEYAYEVQVGRREAPAGFDPDRLWVSPATDTVPEPRKPAAAPAAWPELVPVDRALAEVRKVTGLSKAAVVASKRGRHGNPARLLAMWWLGERAGLGTNAIARELGCTPPLVSRARTQVRESTDPQLASWRDGLVKLAR